MAHNQHRVRTVQTVDSRTNPELNHTYLALPETRQAMPPELASMQPAPPSTHPAPARNAELDRAPSLGGAPVPDREPTQ